MALSPASEKLSLEKGLRAAQQELEEARREKEKLQLASNDLRLRHDTLEEEKEGLLKDQARAWKEVERRWVGAGSGALCGSRHLWPSREAAEEARSFRQTSPRFGEEVH